MYAQLHFNDALDTVLAWNLPDDLFPIAMGEQIKLLAGFDVEASWIDNFD